MNRLIKNYFSLTDTGSRRMALDMILQSKDIHPETRRILNYLWQLRYNAGPEAPCGIVKDTFLIAVLEILSLNVEVYSESEWEKCQHLVIQNGYALGLEDYYLQSGCGRQLFILEYANFASFYLQFDTEENLYTASSAVPQKFGLYKIFAPFREGISLHSSLINIKVP